MIRTREWRTLSYSAAQQSYQHFSRVLIDERHAKREGLQTTRMNGEYENVDVGLEVIEKATETVRNQKLSHKGRRFHALTAECNIVPA